MIWAMLPGSDSSVFSFSSISDTLPSSSLSLQTVPDAPQQGGPLRGRHDVLEHLRHLQGVARRSLSGGLLNNAEACYAFMQEHPDVVPIWGIQHEWELDQWLELTERNPRMTPELQAVIDHDRTELSGDFCRSCGYCLPCAAGIDIPQAARMAQLLRRAPYKPYLSDEWREKMHQIKNCIHCNACKSRCPYGLDTPALLQKQLADYDAFYAAHHND